MAVLWFEETDEEEVNIGQTKRTYTRFFKAATSHPRDGRNALILARPDLAPFQPHYEDPGALVDTFNANRTNLGAQGLWKVTVDYSTDLQESSEENPLARGAEIEFDSADRKRIRLLDANGKPVINAAGDLLDDPPPEIEESDLIISVKKNMPTRLPAWVLVYRNAVNSDVVRVKGLAFPVGTLKLKRLRVGKEDVENKTAFVPLSFELHHRDDGWTEKIPNRGFYERVPKKQIAQASTGASITTEWKRKQILINGEPAKEPQMLDRNGRLIERPTLENIVLLDFDFNRKLPFSVLPLK